MQQRINNFSVTVPTKLLYSRVFSIVSVHIFFRFTGWGILAVREYVEANASYFYEIAVCKVCQWPTLWQSE